MLLLGVNIENSACFLYATYTGILDMTGKLD